MDQTKKRRIEITIETHDLMIIRTPGGKSNLRFCRSCGENVNVFAPAHAAFIFRVEEKFLERLFQSNEIHATHDAELCANSLIEYFK